MGFNDGGQLAQFIRGDVVAPLALAALMALPEARREESLARCAAAFEGAANGKNGHKLLACSPESIIKAVLFCAACDLYPGGLQPQIYLIPYGGMLEAQVSYHGLKAVALRSGNTNIRARAVYEGESFESTDGTEGERFRHERKLGVERDYEHLVAVYCVGNRPDGSVGFEFLDKVQIEKRKRASKTSGKDTPWNKWPEEMALKTAIRYAINRGTFPLQDRFELSLSDSREARLRVDVIDVGDVEIKRAPTTAKELLLPEMPTVANPPAREPVPVVQGQAGRTETPTGYPAPDPAPAPAARTDGKPRADCPVCGKSITLTAAGTMRKHSKGGQACTGSGEPPIDGAPAPAAEPAAEPAGQGAEGDPFGEDPFGDGGGG